MPVLVTCKFEKNLIKNNREKVDIVFPIISQWALSVAMETSFDPICPKTLCNISPTLMMLHIKFVQHWPTGLRDIQVSSELWQNDRTTEFRKDKANPLWKSGGYNERASMETPFSHYKSMGNFLDAQGQLTL